MNALTIINFCLCAILALCYAYQFVYIIISYAGRKKVPDTDKRKKLAVLICARNEEKVIGRLLSSLSSQDYPRECYSVFVAADNCTDKTASVAREGGAVVYERENRERVGKGYALDFLINSITRDFGDDAFDAFIIFDADNIAKKNYLTEMNKTLEAGYDCVTSYRAPLNYADNWITAGQGMCFLRDMVLLNRARMTVGGASFVSGTGYAFTRELLQSFGGGWPFTTLTEDCEFTVYNAVSGTKMGYSDTAVFYDEQPTKFRQSWNQRLRWCKGGIQVFVKYIGRLIREIFRGKLLSCLDMTMCMAPAYLISVGVTLVNTVGTVIALALGANPIEIVISIGVTLVGVYLAFLAFSVPLTISEWEYLGNSGAKKILYMLTFPFFMLTFLPITCTALVKRRVTWHITERKG